MTQRAYILILLIVVSSCRKDQGISPDTTPFKWVELDHELTYNYYSLTDTTINALKMTIITNPGNTNLRFKFHYPQWNSVPWTKSVGYDYSVYRKMDGLYTSKYTGCGMAAGFGPSFEFVRAPFKALAGDFYPSYLCKDKIFTAYKVVASNEEITVPGGKFTTYILQDTMYLTKEYWDEQNGIIKFVLYDRNGILTGEYQLSSKNY